jgi:nucleolar complex protein 3
MVKEEQQLGFLANVNPDELKLVEKKGRTGTPKQRKKALKAKRSEERGGGGGGGGGEPRLKEVEHVERKAFTKDWEKSLNMTASLPIKRQDGTVVKTMRPVEERDDEDEEEDEEEEAMEVETAQEEETVEPEEENEFDTIDIDELSNPKPKDKKVKELSLNQKKLHIADICNSVTSDPMETLRRQRTNEISTDDVHKLADLLRYLKDTDPRVQEVAMLSCLLVFKDICPSYRIRSREEYDKNVMLKKDTKKLRDYELALLASYQSYLKFLATTVATGLGSSKRDKPLTGEDDELKPAWELGLSALRCQCELTRFLLHFNMRTSLLESIVTRATQPLESVSAICCQTLKDVFTADTEGEVSFEIVGIMGKKLMSCKYNVPVAFLQTLDHVKLRVHADRARDIRRKAKQNRRKR